MAKRIVSIWFPRLSIDRLIRRHGSVWRDNPGVQVTRTGNRAFISAVNAAAEDAGISPNMALADARAVLPALRLAPADPSGDAAALYKLAHWCERFTPWAATEGMDGLFLDITGCAHLWGDERALYADIFQRFVTMGLEARIAIASTPGAAWAVSHFGSMRNPFVAPGRERETIEHLPVSALRLEPSAVLSLDRLGLKSVGALMPLPRASLVARFGRKIASRVDQALGRIDEPISPLRPAPSHRVHLRFPEAISRIEDIAAGLDRLLAALCRDLEKDGKGGRRFELTLFRVDHESQRIAIGTALPLRDPLRLKRLFAEKFELLDPGFGIEVLLLSARTVETFATVQSNLMERTDDASSGTNDDLADLIDRLHNRLGPARVVRFKPLQSHMPERSYRRLPAGNSKAAPWHREDCAPPRPLSLLNRPEALDVPPAVNGMDGDPPVRFSWRRSEYRLRSAQGPERILPEWWHGDRAWNDAARDYWRVEDETGLQFWLFREASTPSRWFLHGFFT